MENERFKEKIRRVAGISIVILAIYLLMPLFLGIKNFCAGFLDGYHSAAHEQVSLPSFLLLLLQAAACIGAVWNAIKLLLDMRKGETPFTGQNGRRIRRIGILLMILEPLLLLQALLSGGELPEIYGISFAAGLILYNIALLFAYGSHLQQESDETL